MVDRMKDSTIEGYGEFAAQVFTPPDCNSDRIAGFEHRFQPLKKTDVFAVDVNIHEAADIPAFVADAFLDSRVCRLEPVDARLQAPDVGLVRLLDEEGHQRRLDQPPHLEDLARFLAARLRDRLRPLLCSGIP